MNFSLDREKISYLLNFVIMVCLGAVIYLIYHIYFTKAHYVALSCSSKVSLEEYEHMKKELTRTEVKKLTSSKEYQEYLRKKSEEGENMREQRENEENDVAFSEESEKES